MIDRYLSQTKTLLIEFVRYYLAAVLVLGLNGELFNIALRFWSNNQMSFYSGGLWQITFILSFFLTAHVMFVKYSSE
ncbi:TPA: hypothetical protein ACGUTZ_004444 [Vibrio vulnificus]